MKLKVKISITDDQNEDFMGIGLVWLLRGIKKFKSINQAAKAMNLSYVKALKIINRLEENLDKKILIRKRGGKDRGGAELTPFADQFLEEYDRFQKDIKTYSQKRYSDFQEPLMKTEI